MSPVAAVTLMCASLADVNPMQLVQVHAAFFP
jgi:hypothetical protein